MLYFIWEGLDFYPTITDLAFISGYGLFIIAVILKIKLFGLDFKKVNYKVLTFASLVFVLIAGVVGYSGFLGYDSESSFLANFSTFSWSLGDLVSGGLAILLLMMAWECQGGAVRMGWLWFIGAISLNLVADTIYSLNPDIILEGSWTSITLNIVWIAGYFMFAGYFFEQKVELERLRNKI